MTRIDPITKRFLPITVDELIETYISIEQTTGCWIWMGSIDHHGYGSAKVDGFPRRAHRVVYQRLRGEIPAGLHLDHLCRHRFCVNPDHLEPVTSAENTRRALPFLKRTEKCPRGHDYVVNGQGKWRRRRCNECSVERVRRLRAERRSSASGGVS